MVDFPNLTGALGERLVQPMVEVSSGRLLGTREEKCFVFRGIPYAEAPVGRRRLLTPRAPQPWTGVREALDFGLAAPQPHSELMAMTGWTAEAGVGEDCLSLNIWTPALDNGRRPVLVWIHGGAFTVGAGSQCAYDGTSLCSRGDVVVVTLNYRLGALGFLALEALRDREEGSLGNFGIRDQIHALEWVREHIGEFGGDPARVTLFGESAGATSIGALFATPAAEPLFQRAILQSGHGYNISYEEAMLDAGERFMHELELEPGDLDRLLALPTTTLLAAQDRFVLKNPDGEWSMSFQPVVDGQLLTEMPAEALANGSGAGKAMLAGTNRDEMKLYAINDPKALSMSRKDLMRRMDRVLASPVHENRDWSTPVIDAYQQDMPDAPIHELWWALETDRRIRVPLIRMAERFGRHSERTFLYLFDWPSPAFGGLLGSCHTLEIPFVFGTIGQEWAPPVIGEGDAVASLSDLMQDSWIRFAHTGNPSTPGFGDWPAYLPQDRTTAILGRDPRVEQAPLDTRRAAWDAIPEARDRWTRARTESSQKAHSTRPSSSPRQVDAAGDG